jgi:hypothetical protein
MQTRRDIIFIGLSAIPALAADFWKAKKSGEWSDKEIQRLLTKSPWAKEASVEFNMQGMEGMGGPPGGGPPGGGPGGGPEGGMPPMSATVIWESAPPIRAARKKDPTGMAENTYILSISGLPMMGGRGPRGGGGPQGAPNPERMNGMMGRLKEGCRLERKGKDPLACTGVQREEGDAQRILFLFEAGSQPVDLDDKEINFVARMGPLEIRSKFIPKEMVFESKLAV